MADDINRNVQVSTLHTSVSVSSSDKKDSLDKIRKIAENLLDKYSQSKKWGWYDMYCPNCGGKTMVSRTILKKGKVFRYRQCTKCKKVFKTTEMPASDWNYRGIVEQIKRIVNEVS